jgi:hypothetical protein
MSINKYRNLRKKLLLCSANIYFNKQCLLKNITPSYARCKIPYTSPAAITTQRKTNKIRIKDEIRFLYRKKYHLNAQLYQAHLQTANTWGPIWDHISHTIHENLNKTIEKNYHTLNQKLKKLEKLGHQDNNTQEKTNPKFFSRVINLTNINFNEDEHRLLQKGLKYNLHIKPKHWLKTTAIEAETAIKLLPILDQDTIRYQISKTIQKLAGHEHQKSTQKTHQSTTAQKEKRTLKVIQENYTKITQQSRRQTKDNPLLSSTRTNMNTKYWTF